MKVDLSFCNYKIKEKIRTVTIGDLKVGGDSSFAFLSENANSMKTLFATEIPFNKDNFYPDFLYEKYKTFDFFEILTKLQDSKADLISVKFNATEENLDVVLDSLAVNFEKINKINNKPLILRGANNTDIDRKLLPKLASLVKDKSIIAFADEFNYEEIVPSVIENGHVLVLRTPIDINLAKELNILCTDRGLSPDRILIDPDMGGLGYGIEYGYSIVERIKQAGFDGDTMLNMPIIAFIGEESYKAKEAKSDKFSEDWGDFHERAAFWEISAACTMAAAGANIITTWNPDTVKTLKGLA